MSSNLSNSLGFGFITSKLLSPETPSVKTEPLAEPLPLQPAGKLPSHIPALDGIRGLAVILVLFCHATQRPFYFGAEQMINPLDKVILALARLSWTGVDLFFVLSGFLITGILYDAKGKNHFFRNFYARRTVRIFPLYYAALVLFLIIWPRLPAALSVGFDVIPTSEAWYWVYLSNFSQAISEQNGHQVHHILQVTWSLAIEEQFYLCWPLVVFFCSRKTLLRVCVGMFFGSMALRTMFLLMDRSAYAMEFTPCRVDGLAIGAIIALIARGPNGVRSLVKPALWIAPLAAVAITVLVINQFGLHKGVGRSPGYVVVGTALFSLLFGSILVMTLARTAGGWFDTFFKLSIFRTYGKYSYACYLLHMPIMILIANYMFHPSRLKVGTSMIPGLLVYFAITWTATLLVAIVSWNLMEKHFLKLKDYFPMEAKRPA